MIILETKILGSRLWKYGSSGRGAPDQLRRRRPMGHQWEEHSAQRGLRVWLPLVAWGSQGRVLQPEGSVSWPMTWEGVDSVNLPCFPTVLRRLWLNFPVSPYHQFGTPSRWADSSDQKPSQLLYPASAECEMWPLARPCSVDTGQETAQPVLHFKTRNKVACLFKKWPLNTVFFFEYLLCAWLGMYVMSAPLRLFSFSDRNLGLRAVR